MRGFLTWVIAHRKTVIVGCAIVTVGLMSQIGKQTAIVDFDAILPQSHPIIVHNHVIDETFGLAHPALIGVTASDGDALKPELLSKVKRISEGLAGLPGVVPKSILSIASPKVKDVQGTDDGLFARPMMKEVPKTPDELEQLRAALARNPVYEGILFSKDRKTLAIMASFKKDPDGFRAIDDRVQAVVAKEKGDGAEITVSGEPVFLSASERYADRMNLIFPLAILLIGLIHFEAFRTLQGLILPLVTSLLAVIWGTGLVGLMRVNVDPINTATPILILAMAAGHAVQMLKRYYEEFHRLRAENPAMDASEVNRAAVLESLLKTGPVMIAACVIAAISFMSLMVFEIQVIKTFGIFTSTGVLSALALELTLIPAVRAGLKPPGENELKRESAHTVWDRVTSAFARATLQRRRAVVLGALVAVAVFGVGMSRVVVDYSMRGMVADWMPQRLDDAKLCERLSGTNPLYLLVDAKSPDQIKNPALLKAIDELQAYVSTQPDVGRVISFVDFIKTMNRAMNGGQPQFERVPDSQELVAQYLLLYNSSGDAADFDTYVDFGYQQALITVFLKAERTGRTEALTARIHEFVRNKFPPGVEVLDGGSARTPTAFNEVMVKNKVLNIIQVGLAVFLITALFFRSLWAGTLVLVPLALTVIANFGVMGFTGIALDALTALSSAMVVGLGADYAIYFACRLREELKRDVTEEQAVAATFNSAGKAILFVGCAVAGGYALMMLSIGWLPQQKFGFLISLAMIAACVSSLTVFPTLLVALRPRFVFGARAGKGVGVPGHVAAGLLLLLLTPGLARAAAPASPSAEEIMVRSAAAVKPFDDTTSRVQFRLLNAQGQERRRTAVGYTHLQPNHLDNQIVMRLLQPADVKGTTTLLMEHSEGDDDMWIYLPGLKKTRRLVGSNVRDSYMGTEFSYGDIMGHKPKEWSHKLLREETLAGQSVWVIESTPREESVKAKTGYSKRLSWVRKDNFVPIRMDYFDESGNPLKSGTGNELKLVDAKKNLWQTMRFEMKNLKTGYASSMLLEEFKANSGVADEVFTTQWLERQ
jgi:predicted RND superfamily exporter protein